MTKISNQYVKDYSIQDFISSWVNSHNATYKLIDNCIGAHCNPTCPDKIVFLDAGEVWSKFIKTVVIGLSLVITVICSGLKLTFMCYYSYLVKRQENYLTDSETCEARKEVCGHGWSHGAMSRGDCPPPPLSALKLFLSSRSLITGHKGSHNSIINNTKYKIQRLLSRGHPRVLSYGPLFLCMDPFLVLTDLIGPQEIEFVVTVL